MLRENGVPKNSFLFTLILLIGIIGLTSSTKQPTYMISPQEMFDQVFHHQHHHHHVQQNGAGGSSENSQSHNDQKNQGGYQDNNNDNNHHDHEDDEESSDASAHGSKGAALSIDLNKVLWIGFAASVATALLLTLALVYPTQFAVEDQGQTGWSGTYKKRSLEEKNHFDGVNFQKILKGIQNLHAVYSKKENF